MTNLAVFHPHMPRLSPLSRPVQDLALPFHDSAAAFEPRMYAWRWRFAVFGPALATTIGVGFVLLDWFRSGGVGWVEVLLVGLICLMFFWIAFSVSTATAGIVACKLPTPRAARPGPATRVALLVPIYNESPKDVFGNAAAMLQDLARQDLRRVGGVHTFDLFFLSDTRDEDIATDELHALHALCALLPGRAIHYRRRAANTDRKTGNIGDWVAGWGGDYPAMLVLDADSLMTGAAIVALTDALAADPSAGIVQSFPQIFAARSLFGRVQQYSGAVYGTVLALGLAKWSGNSGNFWGHNAILRTTAFADCATLPHIRGRGGRPALILSHDFVEAGLMRRAGWAVRFEPRISGSYEEAPQTLIDYVLRDRRWCQGNLQHLRLLGTAGLHPISRFHMLQGAFSYLLSPAWFVLLVIWALLGNGEASVITYFTEANPMFPLWPEQSWVNGWLVMGFMYGMLLVPKLIGILTCLLEGMHPRDLGGPVRFAGSILLELLVSIALAPVMMLQQMIAVLRTAAGYRETWVPQRRGVEPYPVAVLWRFHALETLTGLALVGGMTAGAVSLWLLPIAASLVLAVPLSALSGLDMTARRWTRRHLATPQSQNPPQVIRDAMAFRTRIGKILDGAPMPESLTGVAAE